MYKRFENKYRMFIAVLEVLNVNKAIWVATAFMSSLVTRFTGSIASIDEARKITENGSKGHTQIKNKLEDELVDRVSALTSSVYLMAKVSGDNVLMQKVNYTESELQTARDSELVSIAETVSKLARENISKAAEYDFDEAEVTALEELTAKFKQSVPAPRASIAERKAANEKLAELMSSTTELVEDELDRMVLRYKSINADFYNSYYNARSIVDYGIRHRPEADTVAEQPVSK